MPMYTQLVQQSVPMISALENRQEDPQVYCPASLAEWANSRLHKRSCLKINMDIFLGTTHTQAPYTRTHTRHVQTSIHLPIYRGHSHPSFHKTPEQPTSYSFCRATAVLDSYENAWHASVLIL